MSTGLGMPAWTHAGIIIPANLKVSIPVFKPADAGDVEGSSRTLAACPPEKAEALLFLHHIALARTISPVCNFAYSCPSAADRFERWIAQSAEH